MYRGAETRSKSTRSVGQVGCCCMLNCHYLQHEPSSHIHSCTSRPRRTRMSGRGGGGANMYKATLTDTTCQTKNKRYLSLYKTSFTVVKSHTLVSVFLEREVVSPIQKAQQRWKQLLDILAVHVVAKLHQVVKQSKHLKVTRKSFFWSPQGLYINFRNLPLTMATWFAKWLWRCVY